MQTWTSLQQCSHRLCARLRQERGQSLVEFALVLPILIPLILGILYFGRYENYSNQETQLAEMGVRWAAVNNNPGATTNPVQTLQAYIQSQAQPELQAGSPDVAAAVVWIYQPGTTATYAVGNSVRVCVVTTVKFPTPVVTIQPGPMAQAATMRIEQVPPGSSPTFPFTAGNPGGAAQPPSSSGCPLS